MMHHPNMHHQPMSGHPPQHLTGHQAMSAHHTLPPPQLHRENRHVTLTRVPLGAGAGGGALGLPVHHAPRPHAARPLHPPHHQHHHNHQVPQMKPMRRGYMGGGYGAPVVHTYAPPAPHHPPPPDTHNNHHNAQNNVVSAVSPGAEELPAPAEAEGGEERAPDDTPANSKEKTPMCLVNELARYNKIKHQYRLTSESGPAHKKVFTVTLRLGDTEEYTAEGSSIKRAQHAAARAALAGTGLAAPPARAAAAGGAPAPRHSVMPTVELNALAMKLCQPAVYTSVPCVSLAARGRGWAPGALLYRVRVAVGGRAWLGEGATPQAARHDAAARALHQLRDLPHDTADTPAEDENSDPLSEVKSPVSLVHELALKRNLTVTFTVKSERGPPHMRVFITICTVGDMETEGEGNGKKVSKRRAAEKMLEEMRRRWPPALLRPRLSHDKRRHQPTKKKPRNLIKVGEESGGAGGGAGAGAGGDNPISRLAVARHALRARSPQYVVVEERGAARRREFLVQCSAPPHSATGLGPNKKTAKRRAAGNVLRAMEQTQDKESAAPPPPSAEARQPVPGVLLMDYHNQRPGQPQTPQTPQNGVTETSPAGGAAGGSSPGARDQLMYLSHLLGFTVQFSDFPKRNHGEYLSLVSLSTEPPVMCHGGGPSTRHSHEQCARAALHALALMGLDTMQNGASSTTSKPSAVPNGISE